MRSPSDPSTPSRLRPRKSLGQNFLVDGRVARRIVEAAAPLDNAAVLEIGPGRGALTAPLLEQAAHIAVVERDRALVERLRRRFGDHGLLVIEANVLTLEWSSLPKSLQLPSAVRLVVVGNLPYNISKPIAMRLVQERRRVERAVLTLQREVADRLVARPGTRAYGPMGILVGEAYEVTRLFDIAPGAFRPRPKVVSSVTRWIARSPRSLGTTAEKVLRSVLAASFAHRRRTLYNNLRSALPGGERAARALLTQSGIDGTLRPQAIPPEGYRRLVRAWPKSALL